MRIAVTAFCVFVIACGRTVSIGDGGDTDGAPSEGSADGPDCSSLGAQIDAEREKLQTCCPTCKSIQCMGSVPFLCCPITIHGGDTTMLAALVSQYRSQCKPTCDPMHRCLPPYAPLVPSGICDAVNNDPQVGRCRWE